MATRIFVLGLSPNGARLSVRFWVEQSFAEFTARFQQHWADLRLDPLPRPWPPPLWRLLLELAPQRTSENIPLHLAGEVLWTGAAACVLLVILSPSASEPAGRSR